MSICDIDAPRRAVVVIIATLVAGALIPAPAHAAIEATIACSPSCSVAPGATVTFTPAATSTTVVTRYEWDLDGDGLFGLQDAPGEPDSATPEPVRRTFSQAGSFAIGVRVSNLGREQATATQIVTVGEAPPPPPPPGPPPPPPPPPGAPPPGPSRRRRRARRGERAAPVTPLGSRSRRARAATTTHVPGRRAPCAAMWRGCAAVDLMRGARVRARPCWTGSPRPRCSLRGRRAGARGDRPSEGLVGSAATSLERGRPCPARTAYRRGLAQLDRAMAHVRARLAATRRRATRRLRAGPDVTRRGDATARSPTSSARWPAVRWRSRVLRVAPSRRRVRRWAAGSRCAPASCRSMTRPVSCVSPAAGCSCSPSDCGAAGRSPRERSSAREASASRTAAGWPARSVRRPAARRPASSRLPAWRCASRPSNRSRRGRRPERSRPCTTPRPTATGGAHWLESGTRLAVAQRPSCATTAPGGKTLRYSARLSEVVGLLSVDLALDLEDGRRAGRARGPGQGRLPRLDPHHDGRAGL